MHKPIWSWTNALAQLGYIRRRRRNGLKSPKPRSLQHQALEERAMLATDLAIAGFASDGNDLLVNYDVAGSGADAFDIGIYGRRTASRRMHCLRCTG